MPPSYHQTERILRELCALAERPHTSYELRQKFHVCYKTVVRDLRFIEFELCVPLQIGLADPYMGEQDDEVGATRQYYTYRIDKHFLRRFA